MGVHPDCLLIADVCVRFRTTYSDHGYDVTAGSKIALRYIRGWFVFDLLSSFPFSAFASNDVRILRVLPESARALAITPLAMLSLLRVGSIGRLVRIMALVKESQVVRRRPLLAVFFPVACLMYCFVLMAHYLGLGWYLLAIRPLEIDTSFDGTREWYWLRTETDGYVTGVKYICSLYWALSVMTNLKGLPAHETRQCLWHDPEVPRAQQHAPP